MAVFSALFRRGKTAHDVSWSPASRCALTSFSPILQLNTCCHHQLPHPMYHSRKSQHPFAVMSNTTKTQTKAQSQCTALNEKVGLVQSSALQSFPLTLFSQRDRQWRLGREGLISKYCLLCWSNISLGFCKQNIWKVVSFRNQFFLRYNFSK